MRGHGRAPDSASDLLLANEMLDARRLGALDAAPGHRRGRLRGDDRRAAAAGGVREVLIDVNVGLPRCGCAPTRPAGSPTWRAAAGCRSAA